MFATIFEFLGQLPFFVLLFAIFYLIVNKEVAYKFWLTYFSGFAIGSLALKNIINRPRPYQQDASLLAMRNSYSSSMPSSTAINSSANASFVFNSTKKSINKNFGKFVLLIILAILVSFTCLNT